MCGRLVCARRLESLPDENPSDKVEDAEARVRVRVSRERERERGREAQELDPLRPVVESLTLRCGRVRVCVCARA